jgi:hypothetical protein
MAGYRLTAWLRPLLTLAAMAGVLSLAACGGGGGSPANNAGGGITIPLAITPGTATTYSGNAFTFLVTGGKPPYTVISSDQSVLPVVGTLTGNTLVVVPGSVGADTNVTLTVRDSAAATTSAGITVRPALLLPTSITITGNPNCGSSGATLCSGQDGTASVQLLGPAGAPLAGRDVRFDVVQGNFSLSSTAPGQPLVQSLTVTTDQNGNAAVRIVVPSTAATQFGTLRATDVTGGSSVVAQFTISQFVNGNSVLSVIPTGVTTFKGPDTQTCSSGSSATFYVFGGTPPYTIATNFPQAITISGNPVMRSGAGFTITTNGTCFTGLTFAITDATGRVLLTPPTADNVFGTAAPPAQILAVVPARGYDLTGSSCVGVTLPFTVSGGTAPFSVQLDAGHFGAWDVNPTSVSASPGQFTVSAKGTATAADLAGTTTVSLIDASKPTQTVSATIKCP